MFNIDIPAIADIIAPYIGSLRYSYNLLQYEMWQLYDQIDFFFDVLNDPTILDVLGC